MVGNVGVNRVRADCLDFTDVRTFEQMLFRSPGAFEATQKSYFYQRARDQGLRLAKRAIQGERFHSATRSLWFFRPEEIVQHNGIVSGTREDSKHIASSRQPKKIVLKSKRKKVDNL
jgi:N-acetylmuramoyl-L-alanine amidase